MSRKIVRSARRAVVETASSAFSKSAVGKTYSRGQKHIFGAGHLQVLEAAYAHAITVLSKEYDYITF